MTRKPIQAAVGGPDDERARADALRDAYARWASGVAVVAVRDEPYLYAITATSFTPVSLDPPLVLVCIGRNASVWPFLQVGAPFAISILAAGQRRIASIVADGGPLVRPLFPPDGDPVVPDAIAAFACTVSATHPGGDHRIVVGAVERVQLGPAAPPLAYFDREYRTVD
ncbi:MAG: flavin reductase family protein [Gemmatimonadetes bacterium]|nr:flavin reductase family protein [Gemmatimonadota bacterium]